MTIDNENAPRTEQINDKEVSANFYQQLKTFLEKDEFDVFKTKAKIKLDNQIHITNKKIQHLLDLKFRSEGMIKQFLQKKKSLFLKNKKLQTSLIKKLDLEV